MSRFAEQSYRALRPLLRRKRFALTAIVMLGLAIGLNTTMYSVLDALIAPKIPVDHAEQLHALNFRASAHSRVPPTELIARLVASPFVAQLTWIDEGGGRGVVTRDHREESARVSAVADNFFDLLRPRITYGRVFTATSAATDSRGAVITYQLWRTLYPDGSPPATATVTLDSATYMVIGVLAEDVDRTTEFGRAEGGPNVWVLAPGSEPNTFSMIVRLKAGVTADDADHQLATLARRLDRDYKLERSEFHRRPIYIKPFHAQSFHIAIISAVFAVLLVACANLANLQLAHGIQRGRELATRAALGASRRALFMQILFESAWLALGGLILASVLTAWGMQVVRTSIPPGIEQFVAPPQLSWRVFGLAILATVLCLIITGVIPAIRLARVDLNAVLQTGAGTGITRAGRRQDSLLVAIEIATAVAVVTGAFTLVRVAWNMQRYDFGFRAADLVEASFPLSPPYGRTMSAKRLTAEAVSRVEAIHGVAAAAAYASLPVIERTITTEDGGGRQVEHALVNKYAPYMVSPGYFRALGARILDGRDFDQAGEPDPVAIVDSIAAQQWWPNAHAVGQTIKLGPSGSNAPRVRVVGVSKHMWQGLLGPESMFDDPWVPELVVVNSADTMPYKGAFRVNVIARTTGNSESVAIVIRREFAVSGGTRSWGAEAARWASVNSIDHEQRTHDFAAGLFITFALLTLALAAFGVYAIMAHSVAQRTREFGVRIALGARPGDVLQGVLREGSTVALLGVAGGVMLAIWATGLLARFTNNADSASAGTLAGGAALTLIIALAAAAVPAVRAASVDPVEALRSE